MVSFWHVETVAGSVGGHHIPENLVVVIHKFASTPNSSHIWKLGPKTRNTESMNGLVQNHEQKQTGNSW